MSIPMRAMQYYSKIDSDFNFMFFRHLSLLSPPPLLLLLAASIVVINNLYVCVCVACLVNIFTPRTGRLALIETKLKNNKILDYAKMCISNDIYVDLAFIQKHDKYLTRKNRINSATHTNSKNPII